MNAKRRRVWMIIIYVCLISWLSNCNRCTGEYSTSIWPQLTEIHPNNRKHGKIRGIGNFKTRYPLKIKLLLLLLIGLFTMYPAKSNIHIIASKFSSLVFELQNIPKITLGNLLILNSDGWVACVDWCLYEMVVKQARHQL